MKFIKKLFVMVPLVFTLVGILTFVMTFQNLGFVDGFFEQWLSSTIWSSVTMAPLGFLMISLVSKAVEVIMPNTREVLKNAVIGVSMAIIMESFMAFVTTMNNVAHASGTEFLNFWWQAFLIALPVGLMISVIMTLTIKPRLERFMAS